MRPALVRGRVPLDDPERPLVVAVNGVVAATSRSYLEGTDMSFGVMVDEALLRPGRNQITVYAHRVTYWLSRSNAEVASPVAEDSANLSSHSLACSLPEASTIFRGMAGNE